MAPSSRKALLLKLMLVTCRAALHPTPSHVQMSSAPTGSVSQPWHGTVCWYHLKLVMEFLRYSNPCWSAE